MIKKFILHFVDEKKASRFKESWESFINGNYGSIKQRGTICIIQYNCNSKKTCSLPNSIFRGDCQYCG